jgi:hypothetical protein
MSEVVSELEFVLYTIKRNQEEGVFYPWPLESLNP